MGVKLLLVLMMSPIPGKSITAKITDFKAIYASGRCTNSMAQQRLKFLFWSVPTVSPCSSLLELYSG